MNWKSKFNQKTKGSRTMEPRAISEIQKDYGNEAAKLGDADYKIKCIEGEKAAIIQKMNDLNIEAKQRTELDKAMAEAPAKPVEAEVVV